MFIPNQITELNMQTHKPWVLGTILPLGIDIIHIWTPITGDVLSISDQAQYTQRYIMQLNYSLEYTKS